MIVKAHRIAGSGRPVVMVTMTVDEALHVGMELGNDGQQIFDAAWNLLPDDAPERMMSEQFGGRPSADVFPYENTPP